MSLIEKLKKNSFIKETAILKESKFFEDVEAIPLRVPAINVAFSGTLDGGFTTGLTIWAGPSKHFKTAFTLLMAKAYLDRYPDAVIIWYDSEFGSPQSYFEAFGIDTSRVLHTPITNIEELKFDLSQQLDGISRGDKVFIGVDSVGNLASKKEVEDALDQKAVADMTRAKQLKSLFRIVTPILTLKQLPMVVVNHTYQTQEMYSKAVVSGGTGIYYSASNIFILGRSQEKDDDGIAGYNFVINVEKSRTVREKSKISIYVDFEDGINKWSGLMDMALASGHVIKPKNGWYAKVNQQSGEVEGKSWRLGDTHCPEFWTSILAEQTFKDWVEKEYKLGNGTLLTDDVIEEAMESVEVSDDAE